MYDIKLENGAADLSRLGVVSGNDYFMEHRNEWLNEILGKLEQIHFPMELWPTDTKLIDKLIHQCKATGRLPRTMLIDGPFNVGDYDPKGMDSRIAQRMEAMPFIKERFVCFTDGEDWWPYYKFFVVEDAESFLLYCTYDTARGDPTVLDKAALNRGRGRPRNQAKHNARAERAERYKSWLQECADYRAALAAKKAEYMEAKSYSDRKRQELREMEAQGAPRWVG